MKNSEYYHIMKSPILASHVNTPYASNKDFHFHDNYEMFLFIHGHAEAFVEQSRYILEPGSLLIFNNQEIHKACNLGTAPYERILIHFHPSFIQPLLVCNTNLLACFENHQPGVHNVALLSPLKIKEYCTIADKLIFLLNNNVYGKDILTLTYLAELLIIINDIFYNTKKANPEPLSGVLSDIMSYIDSNLSTSLSLEGIAKHLAIDKYYLSHLFKKQTGSSLYHYILTKKISLAKKLLIGGYTVMDTCYYAGFNDYNNFFRTFKKYTGYSPGEYKKSSH
jgi:AraC-type DNA-binding domain-containing proteins